MDRGWFIQICLMFFLVLILPIQLSVGNSDFTYASPIIQLGYGLPYMIGVPVIGLQGFSIAISLMVVFFVSIPAFYANYVIHSRPSDESVTRPIVFAVIMSQPIVPLLLITPFMMSMQLSMMGDFYYALSNAIVYAILAVNWSLLIMVLLPLLQRSVDPRYRKTPDNKSSHILGILRRPSRLALIATILGICLIFIPMMITQQMMWYMYNSGVFLFISAAGMISTNTGGSPFVFEFTTMSSIYYASSFLATGLHFLYLHKVMGYLQSTTSRSKCISTGLLALGGATVANMIPIPLIPYGLSLSIPVPVIFIIGLVVIYVIQPIYVKKELWDDSPHTMWFDKTGEGSGNEEYEEIKIPLLYRIRSKLSRWDNAKSNYEWDKKDVFTNGDPNEE